MNKILYTAIIGVLCSMHNISEGMLMNTNFENVDSLFQTTNALQDLEQKTKKVALAYTKTNKMNTTKLIVDAINEAMEEHFWEKNGQIGNYRIYTKTVAEFVKVVIIEHKFKKNEQLTQQLLTKVIQAIITGKADEDLERKADDLVRLGLNRSRLSSLNIWNSNAQ